MTRRSLVVPVFLPVGLYVVTMLALAAFVTHPPLLGWIGLGVASGAALTAGAIALALLTRARTNAPRLHPHDGYLYRLLVVTDAEVEPAQLSDAVKLRTIGRRSEVRVVAPVVASNPLHLIADDETGERIAARYRLETALRSLSDHGVDAEGVVGADDPLQAVGDSLAEFPADELLLVARVPSARSWLDRSFEGEARDLFGIPVSTIYAARSPGLMAATEATARSGQLVEPPT